MKILFFAVILVAFASCSLKHNEQKIIRYATIIGIQQVDAYSVNIQLCFTKVKGVDANVFFKPSHSGSFNVLLNDTYRNFNKLNSADSMPLFVKVRGSIQNPDEWEIIEVPEYRINYPDAEYKFSDTTISVLLPKVYL